MKILVDADSCPCQVRELVLRSSKRLGILAVFAANRLIPGINGKWAKMEICPSSEGAADNRIAELAQSGDLVITRDVPLALRLVEAGITVISDRGREYSKENIREMLSIRNFTVGLAESGIDMERSPAYGKKELKSFADTLDKMLTKMIQITNNR